MLYVFSQPAVRWLGNPCIRAGRGNMITLHGWRMMRTSCMMPGGGVRYIIVSSPHAKLGCRRDNQAFKPRWISWSEPLWEHVVLSVHNTYVLFLHWSPFLRQLFHVFILLSFTDFLSFRPCLTCPHCLSLPGDVERKRRYRGFFSTATLFAHVLW